jgi:hypothetical protein
MQLDKKTKSAWVLEEIVIPDNAQTREACDEFVRRWKDKTNHVIITGDASGAQRNTTTQETNHSIMRAAVKPNFARVEEGWDYCNPTQFSRVQATNALFDPAIGEPRFWIHPSCKNLILDFETVAFKPGTQSLLKDDPLRGHTADAATYPIAKEFAIDKRSAPPKTFAPKGFFS